MLIHSIIGPDPDGFFLAVYPTPGTIYNLTVAASCRTREQAQAEADRLNIKQVDREEDLAAERELCGMRRMSRDLGAVA